MSRKMTNREVAENARRHAAARRRATDRLIARHAAEYARLLESERREIAIAADVEYPQPPPKSWWCASG